MGSLSATSTRAGGQILAAGIAGALIGVAGGSALTAAMGWGWPVGALIGGLGYGAVAAWADARRVPGRPQPLLARIAGAVLVAAVAGWLLELVLPEWPMWVPGLVVGLGVGLAGFRLSKAVVGAGIGVLVGIGLGFWAPGTGWAVPAAVTVLLYRLVAALRWRGRDQIRIVGEGMAADAARFVVPFAEATKHVGVDYLERYARSVGAGFTHNPSDIGILVDFDQLRGPGFDPEIVHPMVREFYEHTSRFTLSIVPEWKRWMRLPYRMYRATVARPLGQANAPFEIEETQRGVVSWIDTIDMDHDGITDYRAWIRAYQDGEPLYVGIYTVQEIDAVAYVAVGFPVPAGNFTATLAPTNHRGDGLRLSSDSGAPYAGHYLSFIDDDGLLTTIQLRAFGEEIEVFMSEADLKTEHRFTLGGILFLTLHYEIARKSPRQD